MNRSFLPALTCCALLVAGTGTALAQTPTTATAALPDFTGIVEQNAPAVVHVEAKYDGANGRFSGNMGGPGSSGQTAPGQGMPNDPQAEILRRLFGMPMMPSPEAQKHTSLGSGFIISRDGYVLTNNHVVAGADKVTVRLQDRRTLTAKVVGTDPKYDIALLKVSDGDNLPVVRIGDSRTLKAGQWVLAIGSPFGFDYTVTQGIVSAVGRNLGRADQPYTSFIQTDVPINRGNSGGPLFNMAGQVVGINSQIYSNTGGYLGVAFSIPIDVAMNAVEQIKTKGYVSRGMLGIALSPVTDDMVKAFKLPSEAGAAVVEVTPGSGADKAGIQAGDIILSYNGRTLNQASDLPPMVGMTKPGTIVPVVILRAGKQQTVKVVIGEMPRDEKAVNNTQNTPAAPSGSMALGMAVKNIDGATAKSLGIKAGQGVLISSITGPVAAQAGLREGDVILMVNQQKVTSVATFKEATSSLKAGDTVLLLVQRGEQSNFVALTLPSKQ
ncbi:MAG: Do family serine endopeptidase [Rhodanobacter sp.]